MTTKERTREIKRFLGRARVFGCRFTKRNGEIRTGSFRLGVKPKGSSGRGGPTYDAESYGNIIVFDMNKHDYRTIPLRRVHYFTVRGRRIHV
jgi:hypothetical protein